MPVEEIEAAVVRHYTSRAGDPHRHLHLQINARVWAAGRWRGLHTVGVRDSLEAINGIGHAAVMCDPAFRAALAARGYTLDPESGEIPSWRISSARSVPGRDRSRHTSTPTRPRGGPSIPARSQGRGCVRRGTAGLGDRSAGQGGAGLRGGPDASGGSRSCASSGRATTVPAAGRRRCGAEWLDREDAGRDRADAAGGSAVGVEPRRRPG